MYSFQSPMGLVQEIFGVIGLVSGCQKSSIIFIELGRLELYHKKVCHYIQFYLTSQWYSLLASEST